ncbi:tRNA-specific 2-thiouridylase MnmA [Candidatus Phaeomarinobacter ectocarpi]|uniref:tRNA-specific 2-thiouridylase MnmA n=2 Tax=Candidatus Phaeomarinibacter ectocarpi TaxID=1458461 RepID=X5M6Y6_9HYPH|nr:tRNA-specific 2-thiouridylase MnmA [Candidatus Phaeomarinobacter ectocarpi]
MTHIDAHTAPEDTVTTGAAMPLVDLPPVIAGKAPADTRVVVAMSGGVDSSVAAALYAQAGYDVVGITLQLYDHGAAVQKKGACCAGQDIHDARRVAERLDIPHYVLDYESRFKDSVMTDFADAYARGETPIPCVRCNERVKFRDLMETARDLGADALATGHYVQRFEGDAGAQLHRAVDDSRDQSYFMFTTKPEQLAFLRFPLGGLPKDETRALAQKLGLEVAAKPDSQDICFVPDGKYAQVVERLRPEAAEPGDIVHMDGRVLGTHDGIIRYTIGQRRGLGISDTEMGGENAEPLFVVRLNPEQRQVIVGPRSALGVSDITLADVNWIGDQALSDTPMEVNVKVRSTGRLLAARIVATDDGALVTLSSPEEGVSPGQACVFYDPADGSRVLGGGWIRRTV